MKRKKQQKQKCRFGIKTAFFFLDEGPVYQYECNQSLGVEI